MGRLFGTDGVRGIANEELTCERAMQIGRAAAEVLSSGSTFLMIQKEMKYHLLIAQIIPTPVITMAQLFISQQLVIKQV